MPSRGSFQNYLAAAIQLKSALVKARPGRQEWEQAPPFMRCTAAAVDSIQRARAGTFNVQYSTALQLKEQGNELISKDPAAALERYSQALSVFLWFDRGSDRAAEDMPLLCSADKLQGAEQDQAYHLLAVAFSNAAACLLQLGMAADAAYACSKALKYDPHSVKALYRRALAHRQAGTTAGLEVAVSDLAAANQLEPANNQVRLALAAVQHELREQRRRERGMYGNMFQHGVLYGDHPDAGGGVAAGSSGPANGGGGDGDRMAVAGGVTGFPAPKCAAAAKTGSGSGGGAVLAAAARLSENDDDEGLGAIGLSGAGDDDGGTGIDPEDLLFMDPDKRKAEAALASREADLVMRKMQVALARSRNRKMVERLDAERAARVGRFPWWAVPWWAYVLIGLHLAYRLIKVWRLPPASGTLGPPAGTLDAGLPEAAPGGPHVEL